MTDSEIILSVTSGDTEKFNLLVSKYSRSVYRLCLGLSGNHYLAEEATQETFIDAFLRLPSLADREKVSAWLSAIARRKCYRQVSKIEHNEDICSLSEIMQSDDSGPLDQLIRREKRERVRAALERLSVKQRDVAKLYYINEMKLSDIAVKLSVPMGTVKSRLSDARIMLRKELYDMNEYINEESKLEREISEKIKQIANYYCLNGGYDDGFKNVLSSAKALIDKLPNETKRQGYLADALLYESWSSSDKSREKMLEAAYAGGNAKVVCHAIVDDLFGFNGDYEGIIRNIDESSLGIIDKFGKTKEADSARGIILFWRGRAELKLGNTAKAKENFSDAARMILHDDTYYSCAVAALRTIEKLESTALYPDQGFTVTGEGLLLDGSRILFAQQPGFSQYLALSGIECDYESLLYHISSCKRTLLDSKMKPGDKLTDEKGGASLECISDSESVTVPAGSFENCIHNQVRNSYMICDAYFAPNVGLVFAKFRDDEADLNPECYELTEYEIKGGKGYFPLAAGNRWVFKNPEMPDFVINSLEWAVEYKDKSAANLSSTLTATLDRNYENSSDLDSSVFISIADKLCDEWKLDEAIEMLKRAVRHNTGEASVMLALAGIETLGRFSEYQKKGYRFCPSSIGASNIRVSDGKVLCEQKMTTFGPYRYGCRGRYEDRIFGIKVYRYLCTLMGCNWSDEWVPGYSCERDLDDGNHLTFTVEDGGTVTVPAGSFDGCRKITLAVSIPDDADEKKYFFADGYSHMNCGEKVYWYAPSVGIVRVVSTWGTTCQAECVLSAYKTPAADKNEFLPIEIGNSWEYDEVNLTNEGYRAKFISRITSGMNGSYRETHSQEFICFKTEDEYNEFVKVSHIY